MRKILSLFLALFLLLGLLSGCDEEAEPTETAARPTVTTVPESEETEETTELEEPGETETPEETESVEESPLNTTVLRSGDAELLAEYCSSGKKLLCILQHQGQIYPRRNHYPCMVQHRY